MDQLNTKKFDRLALIISKMVTGMEDENICNKYLFKSKESKLNELFTKALLGEELTLQSSPFIPTEPSFSQKPPLSPSGSILS